MKYDQNKQHLPKNTCSTFTELQPPASDSNHQALPCCEKQLEKEAPEQRQGLAFVFIDILDHMLVQLVHVCSRADLRLVVLPSRSWPLLPMHPTHLMVRGTILSSLVTSPAQGVEARWSQWHTAGSCSSSGSGSGSIPSCPKGRFQSSQRCLGCLGSRQRDFF